MRILSVLITATLLLIGCGQSEPSKFASYSGATVSHVIIQKKQRRMYIMDQKEILATYKIDLGFNPQGHKLQHGDGRTPEGWYKIDRENRNSTYYLSLGINYPNAKDRAASKAAGVKPGGDIFIHGGPRYDREKGKKDWTAGCVSVTNAEMREIFAMVPVGTWVKINP
jgi:murein L,D-transpeptidase YafK